MTEPQFQPTLRDLDQSPESLPVPQGFDKAAEYDKLRSQVERLTKDVDKLTDENTKLRSSNETRAILDSLIRPYAGYAYWFMIVYCVFVAYVLIADATKRNGFQLPESVLNFLVGSTAVTVIGLVGMVLTGIFVGARPK